MFRNSIILLFSFLTFTLNAQITWTVEPEDQIIDCKIDYEIDFAIYGYLFGLSATTSDINCGNVKVTYDYIEIPEIICDSVFTVNITATDQCSNTITKAISITLADPFTQNYQICTNSCGTIPNCHECNFFNLLEGVEYVLPYSNGDLLDWPTNLCFGKGVPHNLAWFSFVAANTDLRITISPIEYTNLHSSGIQTGVYDFCRDEGGVCIGGAPDCSFGLDDVTYDLADLVVGKTYYLFVDGCASSSFEASQCTFEIFIETTQIDPEAELGENACSADFFTFSYFYDLNENGTKDSSEIFFKLQQLNEFISIDPLSNISVLGSQVELHMVQEGTYDLTFTNDFFLPTNMPSSIEVLENQGVVNYSFGIIGNDANPNIISNLNLTSKKVERCNDSATFSFEIKNSGNLIINEELTLQFDSLLQFSSADIDPTSFTESTLTWQIGDLLPKQNFTINVVFNLPNEDYVGEILCVTPSSIYSDVNSNTPYCFPLRCAFDPNDKHGIPFRGGENYTLFDETLKYTIRFENLGNLEAIDIHIEDQLSSDLDWTTFKLLQSSHDIDQLRINREGVLKISFDEINLPSIEMDSILNKGFVQFSIEQKPGLAENTILENTASIFFDKNAPIITNTTRHNLVSMLPILDATSDYEIANDLLIYPNPGSSVLYIDASIDLYELKSIKILNTKGQSIIKHDLNSHSINVQNLDKGLYIIECTSKAGKIRIAKYVKL